MTNVNFWINIILSIISTASIANCTIRLPPMSGKPSLSDYNAAFLLKEFDELNTPYETIKDNFQSCSFYDDMRYKTCRGDQASCKFRCGSYNGRIYMELERLDICSCDVFCSIIDDCCWDYEAHCPVEKDTFDKNYSYLTGVNVSCENNLAILEGPIQSSGLARFKQGMMLSSRKTGLNFRNFFAYDHFFKNSLDQSVEYTGKEANDHISSEDIVFWTKSFTSRIPLNISDVQDIIETGISINKTSLTDIEPPSLNLRACRSRVLFMCLDDYYECNFTGQILQLESMNSICGVDFRSYGYTTSNVISTSFSTSTNPFRFYEVDLNAWPECLMKYEETKKAIREVPPLFKMLFSVDTKEKTIRVKNMGDTGLKWETVKCSDEIREKCFLVPVCKRGFLYALSHCRRPTQLIMQAIGKNYESLMYTLYSVDFIMSKFPDSLSVVNNLTMSSNKMENSDFIRVQREIILTLYELEPDGTDSVITNDIFDTVEKMAWAKHPNVLEVIVCFALDGTVDGRESATLPLFCDVFVTKGNISRHHFEVEGLQNIDTIRRTKFESYKRNTAKFSIYSNFFHSIAMQVPILICLLTLK